MTNEPRPTAETVFCDVLDRPIQERADFLALACGADPVLRREVESLLAAHVGANKFLRRPALDADLRSISAGTEDPAIGRTIGAYRIVRLIGSGGMGRVFLAERAAADFRMLVAIKLIRRGLDTDEILRRFHVERQVLADLQHPNVARLIDGGEAEDGSPYLVMEYVDGLRIDEYCDERSLSIVKRLDIFLQVCEAVQYAHQHLIVHRDLKPSNIFVTPDGQVKLLDFGVAKVLEPGHAPDVTARDLRWLTPSYASPEQVRGDPISTASDIYSLGAILYELLTGHHAHNFPSRSAREIERVVCDEIPGMPSTVAVREVEVRSLEDPQAGKIEPASVASERDTTPDRLATLLRGDLDTIVLMALRKEPQRRYATVGQFAEDIRRYLDGMPVVARPNTFRYRSAKFIRRHRVSVAAAFAVFWILVGAVAVSTNLYLKASASAKAQARLRADAEFREYVVSIAAAEGSLRDHDSGTARRRLEAAPVELRNWEWHFLSGQLDGSIRTLVPENSTFGIAVAASPDGETIAGSFQGAGPVLIMLWNTSTGQAIRQLTGHDQGVFDLAFRPDGRQLASASLDRTVRLWRIPAEAITATLRHDRAVSAVEYHPDGKILASACYDGKIRFWDLETNQVVRVIETPSIVTSLAYSPDGSFLGTGAFDGSARIWDAATGELRFHCKGHDAPVAAVAIGPDGTRMASASFDRTVTVWDTATGELVETLRGHNGPVNTVVFTSPGNLLTGSGDFTLKLWSLGSGVAPSTLLGHTEQIRSVVRIGSTARIASNSNDGSVKFWDIPPVPRILTLRDHGGPVLDVAISGENKYVVSATDQNVNLWKNGVLERVVQLSSFIHRVAIDPNDRWIAAGSWTGEVYLIDMNTGEERELSGGHEKPVSGVVFSPRGDVLVTGSLDGTIRVWDVESARLIESPPELDSGICCAVFSPDGSLLATGTRDSAVQMWDVRDWSILRRVRAHSATVVSLAFSPDGEVIASGSSDAIIRLSSVPDLGDSVVLRGHTGAVTDLDFTRDGTRLLSSSEDGTLKLWDTARGKEVATLRHHEDRVTSVAFAADDSLIASGSVDRSVKLWRLNPPPRRDARDSTEQP